MNAMETLEIRQLSRFLPDPLALASVKGPALALCLAIGASGCASIRGEPARSLDPNRDILRLTIDTVLTDERVERELESPTVSGRNDIILARIAEIDALYRDYETRISREIRETGFATTLAELAIDGAGALVSGSTSQILSAISAGLTGATEAFDKEILVDRTVQALTIQMRANRARVETAIRERMANDVNTYPLTDAVGDLVEYSQAGTLAAALLAVSSNASSDDEAAQASLAEAKMVTFGPDDNSQTLDDLAGWNATAEVYENQANRSWIQDWIDQNVEGQPPISIFTEVGEYQADRQRAIAALAGC